MLHPQKDKIYPEKAKVVRKCRFCEEEINFLSLLYVDFPVFVGVLALEIKTLRKAELKILYIFTQYFAPL